MEKLLEKNLYRHYQLIQYLTFKDWTPLKKISTEVGLSIRSIQKDISDINAYITPSTIETSTHYGTRIILDKTMSYSSIFSLILKESSNFLILEYILLNPSFKLIHLADNLFMSESTLKRRISQMNQSLMRYHFTISTEKLSLVGDEKEICSFYYRYFYEKYTLLDFIASDEELTIINQAILEFFHYFPSLNTHTRKDFSYQNKLKFILFINFKRMTRHTESLTGESAKGFTLSNELCHKIKQFYAIEMTDYSTYRLFFLFLNPLYIWPDSTPPNSHSLKIWTSIQLCLSTIEQKEQLNIPNKNEIQLSIYNTVINIWARTKILYHPGEEFFSELNTYYSAFTKRVTHIFETTLYCPYVDSTVYLEIQFILVTMWKSLTDSLNKIAPKISLGIFCTTGHAHAQFWLQDLGNHFKDRFDLTIIDAHTLDDLKSSFCLFDIIITNLDVHALAIAHHHILNIHANPTISDFTNILAQYNELIEREQLDYLPLLKKENIVYT